MLVQLKIGSKKLYELSSHKHPGEHFYFEYFYLRSDMM